MSSKDLDLIHQLSDQCSSEPTSSRSHRRVPERLLEIGNVLDVPQEIKTGDIEAGESTAIEGPTNADKGADDKNDGAQFSIMAVNTFLCWYTDLPYEDAKAHPIRAPRRRYDGPAPVDSRQSTRLQDVRAKIEVQQAVAKPEAVKPTVRKTRRVPALRGDKKTESSGNENDAEHQSHKTNKVVAQLRPAESGRKRGRGDDSTGPTQVEAKRARQRK